MKKLLLCIVFLFSVCILVAESEKAVAAVVIKKDVPKYSKPRPYIEVVKEMAKKGQDLDTPGEFGLTPLLRAAGTDDFETVKFLVSKGANVNYFTTEGATPLIGAVMSENIEMVKFLLNKGADTNFESADGNSALIVATIHSNNVIRNLLIKKGAKINYIALEKHRRVFAINNIVSLQAGISVYKEDFHYFPKKLEDITPEYIISLVPNPYNGNSKIITVDKSLTNKNVMNLVIGNDAGYLYSPKNGRVYYCTFENDERGNPRYLYGHEYDDEN